MEKELLSDVIVHMKYARFLQKEQRKESWVELVDRNKEMHQQKFRKYADEIGMIYEDSVKTKKVLPSMRSMQFAGTPIHVTPNRMYNCAFLPVDDLHAFSETMFLLLSGTGVGYSVQSHSISLLPEIKKPQKQQRFVVADTIEGWADAVKHLLKAFMLGIPKPIFDFSLIRPQGAPLLTSGGTAPGFEPLKQCLDELELILESVSVRTQNKLTPLEAHDMLCHIAESVYAGGIRRAAMIALFDRNDTEMIGCKGYLDVEDFNITKSGEYTKEATFKYRGRLVTKELSNYDAKYAENGGGIGWWILESQRCRANNSAMLWRPEVSKEEFLSLWKDIKASGSGEPGFYWTNHLHMGTNPCVEISLRPFQFCNLTEINGDAIETKEDLMDAVYAATFIGTMQASYTDFHYLRNIWKETTEEEALLGVSITGIASNKIKDEWLLEASEYAKRVNEKVASKIGINKAARVTCVKPAGTTSLVLGTSSGIHAWFDKHYIRRVRVGKNEPIYKYLSTVVPELVEDCQMNPDTVSVLSVPQKAPENAILRDESAIDFLERVKIFSEKWVKNGHRTGSNTNNVSATVFLQENEWQPVGDWMWENRDSYCGLSVLPYMGGTYKQAPFESITEEQYESLLPYLSKLDLTQVRQDFDNTNHSRDNVACAGGACEL